MFIETIMLPFIVGLVTNKVSNEIFQQEGLHQIVEELYYKSVDEFNKRYKSAYGGIYNNFLARQENMELVMKMVLSFKDITEIEFGNTSDFFGQPTPQEVVKDFVIIFHENLNEDKRLAQYSHLREHHILTESILNEIKQLKQIRFKKFINPDEFFHFDIEVDIKAIRKLDHDVERVKAALNDANLILIDSFRGFGKTETLKNISVSESIITLFDNVIIMRHGVRNIIDALQTELFQEKKYLIIVDDSELCMDEIKELLNFMKSIGVLSKIIMSVQTYSVEALKKLISRSGLIKELKQISLNNWEKEDYIELLRVAAKVSEFTDEEIIVAKYPSPTLIKWIGEKRKTNIEDLFKEYKELLENDAYAILNDYMSREDCSRFIFSICCSVPFVLNEDQCKSINESIQRSYDIKGLVRLLQSGGILRKVGYVYRFYPDIKGDVFFAYSIKDKYDTDILDYWIKRNQNIVLQNISEASLVSAIDIQDKLKLLIDEWSRAKEYYEQRKNLEIARYIVSFSPESVFNLIYCYFEDSKNSDRKSYWRLTTDHFGPVLLALWKSSDDIQSILSFLCELEIYKLDGTYDNYKVKGLTKDFFSPVKNRPERIVDSLTLLEKWMNCDKAESLTIFKYAASEIVKGSHEVTESVINGIRFGQKIVRISQEVIDMRNKCIEIIEYLVNNKFECRTIETIESICNEIGNMSFGSADYEELPLDQVFVNERKKLVDILGNKLLLNSDVSTNIVIERILMHWWAGQYPGCESTENYLLQFKRDGKYLFAKYYVDVDYRVISFEEIVAIAPSTERWKWFVHEIMHNTNDKRDDSKRIAEMLHREIKNISTLNEFLKYESEIICNFKLAWSSPNIINNWSEYNNGLFIEFIHSEYYFDTIGLLKAPILESVITYSSIDQKQEIINSVLKPEIKLSNEEIFVLLHIAEDEALDDKNILMLIDNIIELYYFEYAGGIIHRLYFIFMRRNRAYLVDILLKIIRKYPFNDSMIDMIDFIMMQYINDLEVADNYQELKKEVLHRISSYGKMDYHEYKIVEILLRTKEEALEFIENRLQNDGIDKVPFEGFPFLTKFSTDLESFKFITCKLIEFVDKNLLTSYDLNCIIKPLFLINYGADNFLGTSLMRSFISEKAILRVLALMNCFILSKETVVDFVDTLKYLNDNGKVKEAENFIYLQRFPEGGWSRSIGQNSPELMNRVSLYAEIYNLLPYGRLKLAAEYCIDYLKKEMDEDIIRDEEILNPR